VANKPSGGANCMCMFDCCLAGRALCKVVGYRKVVRLTVFGMIGGLEHCPASKAASKYSRFYQAQVMHQPIVKSPMSSKNSPCRKPYTSNTAASSAMQTILISTGQPAYLRV
jgi:hypothetical protein